MAVVLNNHNIVYFPVPKTACTSLKMLMFELNNGRKFEMYEEDGVLKHIHNAAYGTPSFIDVDRAPFAGMTRLAVIRDPIARLLSAYSNRVAFHRELSEDHIDADLASRLGVHPNPSPDHFFNNIGKFRILSGSIKHHTDPVSAFLGPDLAYYHRVFRIEDIGGLVELLSNAVGHPLELGREQVGGDKIKFEDLGHRAQRNLVEYCYGDYALMRGYYYMQARL
ncbi:MULTISPECIES: sulfotransferase family 2 domain-containing protein [unclassified Stappia]|uniref:sulfotransferase family 2 domain-containing protein n=1 Tax=unclassified Stappia TaxID=2629676 RepID=UPI001643F01A|nr:MULTISPECIES: sulfotransferase family 2 domain-containing protein [unclassified Stappia]